MKRQYNKRPERKINEKNLNLLGKTPEGSLS